MSKKKKEKKEVKPLPRFDKETEANIFKALAHKSYKDVGREFGIEGSDVYVTSAVFAIARRIKKAPELWDISPDTALVVQQGMDSRSLKKNPANNSALALQEESFRDRLDVMRDTVADIIKKKLEKINTKKGIETVAIRDLKDLLAMTIDKGRLLKGESTENIKRFSSIDTEHMKPEEALAVVLKAREAYLELNK